LLCQRYQKERSNARKAFENFAAGSFDIIDFVGIRAIEYSKSLPFVDTAGSRAGESGHGNPSALRERKIKVSNHPRLQNSYGPGSKVFRALFSFTTKRLGGLPCVERTGV
jgi:hypothetical protein